MVDFLDRESNVPIDPYTLQPPPQPHPRSTSPALIRRVTPEQPVVVTQPPISNPLEYAFQAQSTSVRQPSPPPPSLHITQKDHIVPPFNESQRQTSPDSSIVLDESPRLKANDKPRTERFDHSHEQNNNGSPTECHQPLVHVESVRNETVADPVVSNAPAKFREASQQGLMFLKQYVNIWSIVYST
jgi:hypothetical protein